MKQYLIDTFKFNDRANKTIIEKILLMPQPDEAIRLFSHLINSQNKWMARINKEPKEINMKWFESPFEINDLETRWNKSIGIWLNYLEKLPEEGLTKEIMYSIPNEGNRGVKIQDIALQLNYHSIHHRAQICSLLRMQHIEPPFIEYIGTAVKRY